jgi:hypothetical protein
VFVVDINDNAPTFEQAEYRAELPENMTAGTRVVQVHADDVDSGMGGRIRYTQILGYLNTSLNLDAASGIITVSTNNHGFDREKMPEYHLYVEARDDDGIGNRAEVRPQGEIYCVLSKTFLYFFSISEVCDMQILSNCKFYFMMMIFW